MTLINDVVRRANTMPIVGAWGGRALQGSLALVHEYLLMRPRVCSG